MMPYLKALVVAAAVAALAAAPHAHAQQKMPTPVIGIIDIQRILEESAAAKSIRPQMEKLRDEYEKDVKKRENDLRQAEQELARQRTILSPEAFNDRRKGFEKQAADAQRAVQTYKRRVDIAFANAMGEVRNALLKIAADMAKERQINILLPKSFVVLSTKEFDITDESLGRLNKQLASVKVKLPDEKSLEKR
jgi:Skp family chaperone for outer membrane proteins